MSHTRRFVIASIVLCAAAHAEVKVFPSKTLSPVSYSTYHWLPPRTITAAGMTEDDPESGPLIRAAVNRELAKKGYREVPSGGEMQVTCAVVASKTSQLEGYIVMLGFDEFWGYSYAATVTPVSRINREGAMLFALVDPKTKASVWSGYIVEALGKPGSGAGQLDKAATKLLKKLPERK